MNRWIFAIIIGGVLLTGGVAAFGLGLLPRDAAPPEVLEVSPAAASSAEVKLAQIEMNGEARLTDVELTSLFRFRPEIWSLGIVRDPTVRMTADTLRLNGRFATAEIPSEPTLDAIREILPDTTDVAVAGTVRPFGAGQVVLELASIEVAGMPLPRRFYAEVLDRLGRNPNEPLPAGALALPLPAGIGGARVQQGELVLTP